MVHIGIAMNLAWLVVEEGGMKGTQRMVGE